MLRVPKKSGPAGSYAGRADRWGAVTAAPLNATRDHHEAADEHHEF